MFIHRFIFDLKKIGSKGTDKYCYYLFEAMGGGLKFVDLIFFVWIQRQVHRPLSKKKPPPNPRHAAFQKNKKEKAPTPLIQQTPDRHAVIATGAIVNGALGSVTGRTRPVIILVSP
jgi:hypothetical protein